MHGRKREEYKAIHRDPKMVQKLSAKATAWHQLQQELLHRQKQWKHFTLQQPRTVAEPPSSNRELESTIKDEMVLPIRKEEFIPTTLELLEKAVTVNPDPIWLWNFRRSIVAELLSDPVVSPLGPPLDKEYALTQLSLQNNPKAYAVWHYRKWCVQQQLMTFLRNITDSSSSMWSSETSAVLNHELQLCTLLLQKDERNFHCWSYRRFIVSCCLWSIRAGDRAGSCLPTGEWYLPRVFLKDPSGTHTSSAVMGAQISVIGSVANAVPETRDSGDGLVMDSMLLTAAATDSTCREILLGEWEFTTSKIHDNFSNFSAFHYRSKLLPLMIRLRQQDSGKLPDNPTLVMIQEEFEVITNAIFTEPDDQTAWWYQVFLLRFIQTECIGSCDSPSRDLIQRYYEQVVRPHWEQLRELQQETNCSSKWVLIGVLQCLQWISRIPVSILDPTVSLGILKDEQREILKRLIETDSDRKERYEHLLRKI